MSRAGASGADVRVTHALVRSAVYERLPLSQRRDLHARAAQILVDETQVLDHRLAAASFYDDDLAGWRLVRHASRRREPR